MIYCNRSCILKVAADNWGLVADTGNDLMKVYHFQVVLFHNAKSQVQMSLQLQIQAWYV